VSDTRVTKIVRAGGVEVTVKEISLGEIRAWLKGSESLSADLLDATLFEDFSVADLRYLSSLTAEQAELLTPAELRSIQAAAKELNADFFGFRRRLFDLGSIAAAAQSQKPSES